MKAASRFIIRDNGEQSVMIIGDSERPQLYAECLIIPRQAMPSGTLILGKVTIRPRSGWTMSNAVVMNKPSQPARIVDGITMIVVITRMRE